MSVTDSDLVRDIALEKPSSVRIFEKFGIDYCCGGGKTLEQACRETGVPLERVRESLESAPADGALEQDTRAWKSAPLTELAAHIAEKHHRYVASETPRLKALLEKVAAKHGGNHPELLEIRELFNAMASELSVHMLKEEQVLFPHLERMEAAAGSSQPIPPAFFGSVENPIRRMSEEHDDAGELLKQIRALSHNFEVPPDGCASYQAAYRGLEEFEKDLHTHVHLENNILFPRAVQLEQGH